MGTDVVCHFSTHGWLPPVWETASGVNNILALFSLSVTLSCRGNTQFLPSRSLAAGLLRRFLLACPEWGLVLAIPHCYISASMHSCPFHCRERNFTLISVNQVQIYSHTFVARKQSLGSLLRLLCSPCWKPYRALLPSSHLSVPVTEQACSIFWGWCAENKI